MSAAEKAFGIIKSVVTFQERFDSLEGNLAELGARVAKLADSHSALRDRVSAIEGYLRGRADQAAYQSSLPRIEND